MSKIMLGFISYLLFLAACAQSDATIQVKSTPSVMPTITATVKVTPTLSVRGRWLHGVSCAPPCWEGITVGTTTFTETLTLLDAIPYTSTIEIMPNGIHIERTMPGDRAGLQHHGVYISADPLEEGGVIQNLLLSTPKMKLGEVVAQYGTPSHFHIFIQPIGPHGSPQHWVVRLLWLSQGFELTVLGGQKVPTIDERFIVGGHVYYFAPGVAGYERAMDVDFEALPYRVWEGYGQLDYQATIGD